MAGDDGQRRTQLAVVVGGALGLLVGGLGDDPVIGLLAGVGIGWLASGSASSPRTKLEATARWIHRAWLDRVIDDDAYDALAVRLREEGALVPARPAVAAQAVVSPSAASSVAAPPVEPARPAAGMPSAPPPAVVASDADRAVRRAAVREARHRLAPFRRAWEAMRSDVAVHGLTYLGVLMVFVAVLGFVVFAFSSLGSSWRPLAELSIPIVTFGAAWYLRSRSAPFVAAAMEALGAAVTPVVVFAAFADGSPIPPDLDGAALLATLTVVALGLGTLYGAAAIRRPRSTLRFFAVPLVWVAAGVVGLAFAEQPSAAQFALVACAIVVTPFVARRVPWRRDLDRIWPAALSLVYGLVLLFALSDPRPFGPVAVAGAAVVIGVRLVDWARPHRWAVDASVVAVTAVSAVPTFDAAWLGAAVTCAFLAMLEAAWRRSADPALATPVLALGVAAGVGLAASGAFSLVVAGGLVAVWSHIRRSLVADRILSWGLAAVATVTPALPAIGLARVLDSGVVLEIAGLLLVAGAIAARFRPSTFYRWFLPGWAVVVVATTAVVEAGSVASLAAAAAAATVAVIVAPLDDRIRVWIASVQAIWAGHLVCEALGAPLELQAGVLGLSGLASVGVAVWSCRRPSGDLAVVGHLAGLGAMVVGAGPGWTVVLVGAATLAWLVELVAAELGRSPLQLIDERVLRAWVIVGSGSAVAVGLPATTLAAMAASGVELTSEPAVWVAAAFATAYALTARLSGSRPILGWLAAGAAAVFSLLAVGGALVAETGRPTTIGALGLGISTSLAVPSTRGGPIRWWYGWALATPLVGLSAAEAGLDAAAIAWVLLAWGAVSVLGGLVADDRLAGRRTSTTLRVPWLVPPVVFGVVAVAAGGVIGYLEPFAETWGYGLAIGGSALLAALLARSGWITWVTAPAMVAAGWSLLTDGPLDPVTRPWVLVVFAAVLAAVRVTVALVPASADDRHAWTIPSFVTAHAALATALAIAVGSGDLVVTFAASASVLFAVAIAERAWPWAVVAEVLALVAAGDAGTGWLAAALVSTAVVAGLGALVFRDAARTLVWLSAGSALFGTFLIFEALDVGEVRTATIVALLAGGVGLGWALAGRFGRQNSDGLTVWALPWVTVAGTAMVGVTMVAIDVQSREVAAALSASFLLWSVAAGLSAPAVGPAARLGAAVLGLASAGALGWSIQLTALGWVYGAVVAAAGGTLVGLWSWSAAGMWRRPAALFTTIAQIGGATAAVSMLPVRPPLVVVLASAGVQSLAATIVTGSAAAAYATPTLLTGAWLTFATEGLTGSVEWFTVPVAAALLAMFDIYRWDQRSRGGQPVEGAVYGEYVAMGLLVGPPLTETVATSLGYAALVMGLAVALTAWGIVTRVRRRVYAGGVGALAAAVTVIAVPLARLVPEFRGPALWAVLGGLGVGLIVAATVIEQGRRRVASVVAGLERLMEGWE